MQVSYGESSSSSSSSVVVVVVHSFLICTTFRRTYLHTYECASKYTALALIVSKPSKITDSTYLTIVRKYGIMHCYSFRSRFLKMSDIFWQCCSFLLKDVSSCFSPSLAIRSQSNIPGSNALINSSASLFLANYSELTSVPKAIFQFAFDSRASCLVICILTALNHHVSQFLPFYPITTSVFLTCYLYPSLDFLSPGV